MIPKIPVGQCQCGCGYLTKVCRRTSAARGEVKGQHRRFLRGHHAKLTAPLRKGKPMLAAMDAVKRSAAARLRAKWAAEFGPLSDRELRMIRLVYRRAYLQGLSKGRYQLRRVA